MARGLEGGLPVLEPGALPRLEGLYLELRSGPPVDLPPSWGASPEVLPSLQTLVLNAARLRGPLPAAWARGFRCLERLRVSCGQSRALTEGRPRAPSDSLGQEQRGGAGPSSCGPGERRALPPEWPSGFPALAELALSLDLSGTVPPAWWDSGFGRLAELTLSDNALSGTLPAHVFQTHPSLRRLSVSAAAGGPASGCMLSH